MDVEELRRSQRRHRKSRPERPTDIPLASISGSQDSDEDEEVKFTVCFPWILYLCSYFYYLYFLLMINHQFVKIFKKRIKGLYSER